MKRLVLALLPLMVPLVPTMPARAAGGTEVRLVGTQYVPQWAQSAAKGSAVTWVNNEAANYPAVIGNHNIVPDPAVGALPGNKPFPTSSPLINPNEAWTCEAGDGGPVCPGIDGKRVELTPGRYAYMCGVHPNQMHGILEVS